MSSDAWFVDLQGSVAAEHDETRRDRFYDKIIAIGQAIQAGLQNAAARPPSASQQAPLPSFGSLNAAQATVPHLVDSISTTAARSAFQNARKEIDAAKETVRQRRRQLESSLAPRAPQMAFKQKKQAEDVQSLSRELDIDDVLARTHILVPHVSGLYAHKQPSSESFDENDYYSSQADSFTSSPPRTAQHFDTALGAGQAHPDAEVSEGEFEPELNASITNNLLPALQDDPDAAYEPAVCAIEQSVDGDYEPPKADSPPYEPDDVGFLMGRPVDSAADRAPVPHAIAINHIQSPVAPQPSHISPVTNPTFAQHLDHTAAEQSSKSELETIPPPGKKNKNKPKSTNSNKQKGPSKKRKRVDETDTRVAQKRRSLGDGMPYIKQEPLSPPPLSQGIAAVNGQADPTAATFKVPAGYKLVPIDVNEHSDHTPIPRMAIETAHRHYPTPLLRDSRGVEYYAYAEPQAFQTHDRNHHALAYGLDMSRESIPPQYTLTALRSTRDAVHGAALTHAASHLYTHVPYNEHETSRLRSLDGATVPASGGHNATVRQMSNGYGMHGHAATDGRYVGMYAHDAAYRNGAYQPDLVASSGLEPSRAHSVHPQRSMAPPLHAPVPFHARAMSVYPVTSQQPLMQAHPDGHW